MAALGLRRYEVILWVVLMAVGLWYALCRASYYTDISRLLPEGATASQRMLLGELRSGATGRLLLLALEGQNPERLAAGSRQLGAWMQASGLFQYVGNGAEQFPQQDHNLLFSNRYFLSPAMRQASFMATGLRAALEQRLRDLSSALSPLLGKWLSADPTGEFLAVLRNWSSWTAPAKHLGVWFSKDHGKALLLAETRAAGFDVATQEQVHSQIRAAFTRLSRGWAGADAVRLKLAGPPVFTVAIQRSIEADAWRLSLIASTLVIAFLLLTYRSATILFLSLAPIASAILAGTIAVDLAFGYVHGITLAFGVTLLGVVDDYPIHLFSHMTRERSAVAVMRDLWPTMVLGIITTALGFSAMLLSGFPGLAQLGLFAVVGLVAAAAVTRWVLPQLIPAGFEAKRSGQALVRWIDKLSKARWLVAVAVLAAVLLMPLSHSPFWENDIATLSPMPGDISQLDETLREELGAADVRDLIVIGGKTEEETLQRAEQATPRLDRLVTAKVLAGYELISRYLPSQRTQNQRRAALPETKVLRENLAQAVAGLPFKPGLFEPFLAAAAQTAGQTPLRLEAFRGTALGLKLNALLVPNPEGWSALVPLTGVHDRARLAAEVCAWSQAGVAYMDMKNESNQLVTSYRREMLGLVAIGGLAVAGTLAFQIRKPIILLRIILPVGSALIVVIGLLHGLGERLSLLHLAALLLVIGLGLDYTLFFNRREGDAAERGRTLYGLFVCSVSTVLVFGVMASSRIPVLHQIGLTATLGSISCLLFAALLARPAAS